MNVPTIILNQPQAIEVFHRVVAELGDSADEGCAPLIAVYAQTYLEIQQLQLDVAREGVVIQRPSGLWVTSPKAKMLATLRKHLVTFARALRLTPQRRDGKFRTTRQTLREILTGPLREPIQNLI